MKRIYQIGFYILLEMFLEATGIYINQLEWWIIVLPIIASMMIIESAID